MLKNKLTAEEKLAILHELQAVKDYLAGELSQNQIIDKYRIASRAQLNIYAYQFREYYQKK